MKFCLRKENINPHPFPNETVFVKDETTVYLKCDPNEIKLFETEWEAEKFRVLNGFSDYEVYGLTWL